eukprot:Skav201926  [mRNA]  locus=scaffold3992:301180:302437:+ [translate_table: standard]
MIWSQLWAQQYGVPTTSHNLKCLKSLAKDFHWLFIGAAGAVTPLHIDPSTTHAWLTQISGRKRFTLFAPCDIPELLSGEPDRSSEESQTWRRAVEVVLEPGETIFVPAQWPHEARQPPAGRLGATATATKFEVCPRDQP